MLPFFLVDFASGSGMGFSLPSAGRVTLFNPWASPLMIKSFLVCSSNRVNKAAEGLFHLDSAVPAMMFLLCDGVREVNYLLLL